MSRPASAAAAFSFMRGPRLAKKRGRPRKSGVSRHPGGRIRSDGGTDYAAVHREARVDRVSAARTLRILITPETARTRQEQDIVLATVARARDPMLGWEVGVAFKKGLFSDVDGDGRELLQAADIYAALHRQVWGQLPKDIEAAIHKRYGSDAFNILLSMGRIHAPAPPASHFRKLVGETPAPPGESDPAEQLKRRLRQADRYAKARAVLSDRGLHAMLVIENIVVEGIEFGFLDRADWTAHTHADQDAFVSGLRALAEHFDLFDKRGAPKTVEAVA